MLRLKTHPLKPNIFIERLNILASVCPLQQKMMLTNLILFIVRYIFCGCKADFYQHDTLTSHMSYLLFPNICVCMFLFLINRRPYGPVVYLFEVFGSHLRKKSKTKAMFLILTFASACISSEL